METASVKFQLRQENNGREAIFYETLPFSSIFDHSSLWPVKNQVNSPPIERLQSQISFHKRILHHVSDKESLSVRSGQNLD